MPTPRRYANHAARQAAYRQRQAAALLPSPPVRELPSLPPLTTIPGWRRWEILARQAHQALALIAEEMQAYYDQRSEAWQKGERGEHFAERQEVVAELAAGAEELLTRD